MNIARTLVIASNVFREVIRDRILYLIGFFAIAFLAASLLIPEIAAGAEDKIMVDIGLAGMGLMGLVVVVVVGTALVNKEIEKRTVYVLLSKPVSNAEFIVGKHWGLSAVLAVLLMAMNTLFLLILTARQIPYPFTSLMVAAIFQFLELSLILGVALLFGVFTSSLLAMLLTFGVYLMGSFSRDVVTLASLAENPSVRQITQYLYLVLPDLSRLNFRNEAIYGLTLLPQPLELLGNAVYAVVYTVVLLAIATLIFSKREF
ncbi:MAG: ABC transporter permease [Oculatellaceae cyanobacterium Prado106]|jgi:ABC-type transport system involved in multi-copper enzyme maturation permease subunit|nr:ABC transporter permease [Oculatellaceae cyanobacterium Prado106]